MPTAYDPITGQDVDTASEAWRHLCECRWLLENKPTRHSKHLYLYGVTDRAKLMRFNAETGLNELVPEHQKLWADSRKPPLMKFRGLEAADKLLADARIIYDQQYGKTA